MGKRSEGASGKKMVAVVEKPPETPRSVEIGEPYVEPTPLTAAEDAVRIAGIKAAAVDFVGLPATLVGHACSSGMKFEAAVEAFNQFSATKYVKIGSFEWGDS